MLVEVDDIFDGGNAVHRKNMEQFFGKSKCGKRKNLFELGPEGTLISGTRIRQNKDYSFTWHMNEYASKMKVIETPRGFMTHVDELDESYMSQVMTVNGKIGWIGGNGRPDLAAGHSIIAGDYKTKSPQLVASCNHCVKQAIEHKIELTVWPIPLAEIRFVGFCDSSFDFKGERHQQGWINGFTNKSLNTTEGHRYPSQLGSPGN